MVGSEDTITSAMHFVLKEWFTETGAPGHTFDALRYPTSDYGSPLFSGNITYFLRLSHSSSVNKNKKKNTTRSAKIWVHQGWAWSLSSTSLRSLL